MEEMETIKKAMTLIYEIMDDSRLMKAVAKMYRRLYLNLMEEGFTSDEAMQIVTKFELKKS